MTLTPYIWALWQTKTGKVIIICVAIYLVVGTLIKVFGWWTIPIIIGFSIILYIGVKLENKRVEKEHQRKLKELSDESDRLHRMYEEQQRIMKRLEKKYLKEIQNQ